MSHRKIRKGSPQRNVPNEGGVGFLAIFDQYVVISRKRCILDTKLLWDGNRKPYASYRMVSVSMTLSDPWPGFQGHRSFKGECLENGAFYTQSYYRTVIGNHRHAIDRQASYTAYNPTALMWTVHTFCKRRAGLSATAGLSCFFFLVSVVTGLAWSTKTTVGTWLSTGQMPFQCHSTEGYLEHWSTVIYLLAL